MYRFTITRNGRRCCSGDDLKLLCSECQKIANAQLSGVPPPPPLFGKQFTPPPVQRSTPTRQDGVPPPPDLEAIIRAKAGKR
jgi:hypothetical protein